MFLATIMSRRCCRPELIDQPDLDAAGHLHALRGLERINSWSGSARILWPALRRCAQDTRATTLRVLDMATGAGDVPIRLWFKARRADLNLEMEGCDISPRAVSYARSRAEKAGARVKFFVADALTGDLPRGYDAVCCSLFLHHLSDGQAVQLLRRMADIGRMVLVNDLARGPFGFLLAWVGTRVLTRSRVVHVDGPISVTAAFRPDEALQLARQAGLGGATVARRWPCRYLLSWRKP